MSSINTYYDKSISIKAELTKGMDKMSIDQQAKAKLILESFEAAERSFLEYAQTISKLNDAVAWINQCNTRSEGGYSDFWRERFIKLKMYCNGQVGLNSEIIGLLK